ncbi:HAMP domain-containing sensor histidine kinase [Granulicatella sp. zg-84]|uniref:ATP-binding protein n=1 Tax=Granulicatella sp. zg-84 TaxID=2678503 RepID=UPI0013D8D414
MKKLLKPFGVLDTKYQKIKHKWKRLKALDKKQLNHLVVEGLITLTAILFIYFGCLFLFNKLLFPLPNEPFYALHLRQVFGITHQMIGVYRQIFTVVMILGAIWFTYWRLSRRYRQYELSHILEELDYIASGNYHHRISEDLLGRMRKVAISINKLVDSTVSAMEEERHIEQTKNELITNVSHDIRTPLTSIIGYLSLIEESDEIDEEELKQYVHVAYMKSLQMKRLADNLFDYIKMQDYKEEWQYQHIPIKNFLTQIVVENELEALEKDMTIDIDVTPSNLLVQMNGEQMVRVYDNLISNALKYSQAKRLQLTARQENNGVILEVKNDGQMIDSDVMNKLFVRFYRGDQSRSSQISGSGLGLAIVESIILHHQGHIDVYSTPSETVFRIWLPQTVVTK